MLNQEQGQQQPEAIRTQARELGTRAKQAGVTENQLKEDISQGYKDSSSTGQTGQSGQSHTSGR